MRLSVFPMLQAATASPLESILSTELLERIMVPTPPADLGVLPDKRGGPTPVPTIDSVLRLIGLQRVSRRLRDLVRSLLMSKAGAVLLADAVRHRIYVSLREQHRGCRVGYTEALRDRLLGLADACTLAGREAVCAELYEEAVAAEGAPMMCSWMIQTAWGPREYVDFREQLRRFASNIDDVRSLRYDDHLDRMSVFCAQDIVRTIIAGMAPKAGAAQGGMWAGAQRVVLWADTAEADIPPPLRRLCCAWKLMARQQELPAVSISLRQEIRALCERARCMSPDCVHA